MSIENALDAEAEGRFEVAADQYEACLQSEGLSVEHLVNLIVLYWQATDPGISAAHHFDAFLRRAGERLTWLLAYATRTFPQSPEVVFWKKYIGWCDLGDPFSTEECRALLAAHPDYREPVAFIYTTTRHRELADEALDLFIESSQKATIRAKYIASLVAPADPRKATQEDERLGDARREAQDLSKRR